MCLLETYQLEIRWCKNILKALQPGIDASFIATMCEVFQICGCDGPFKARETVKLGFPDSVLFENRTCRVLVLASQEASLNSSLVEPALLTYVY